MSMTELTVPSATTEHRPTRWMGVGRSEDRDAATAGAAAAAQALSGRTPVLVLVFCSHTYDIESLIGPIRAQLPPEALVVGCTTNGHFSSSAPPSQEIEEGLVVIALGGEGLQATAAMVTDVSSDRRAAGASSAQVMDSLTLEHQVCLLLADGLTRDQHEIVRGGYGQLGAAIPIVGGCSGDRITYVRTYQFLATRDHVQVASDGLVSVGLASDGPIGTGIDHGWSKLGQPFLVTNSFEGQVFELDNRPALEVYLEALGRDWADVSDPDAFRDLAFQHPLGLSRRTGEDIRVVHAADPADGSLHCLADVPQGAIAWLMRTDAADLVAAAKNSLEQAFQGLAGHAPIGVVAFDCGARKVMLEPDGVRKELSVLFEPATPIAGFYTFGEIARTHGARGMHHLTLVTLALS